VLLTNKFLDVAKFTILTPLSLLISCEHIPVCRFENIFPAYFCIESPNKIFMSYLGN
jgi:hypothetical protein